MVGGQRHAPAVLYPREIPGTHCAGGWVGSRAGLDGRKISPPPGFDPRTVQPVVAVPTELPGSLYAHGEHLICVRMLYTYALCMCMYKAC